MPKVKVSKGNKPSSKKPAPLGVLKPKPLVTVRDVSDKVKNKS